LEKMRCTEFAILLLSSYACLSFGKDPPKNYPDLNRIITTTPLNIPDCESVSDTTIDCADLKIAGFIPSTLGDLTALTELRLADNFLSGTIPESFGKLTNLQRLSLWGNALSGTIPRVLGKLTNLEYLYLYENRLVGDIPNSLGLLKKLQHLFLNNNPTNANDGDYDKLHRMLPKTDIAVTSGIIPDDEFEDGPPHEDEDGGL